MPENREQILMREARELEYNIEMLELKQKHLDLLTDFNLLTREYDELKKNYSELLTPCKN